MWDVSVCVTVGVRAKYKCCVCKRVMRCGCESQGVWVWVCGRPDLWCKKRVGHPVKSARNLSRPGNKGQKSTRASHRVFEAKFSSSVHVCVFECFVRGFRGSRRFILTFTVFEAAIKTNHQNRKEKDVLH